MKTKVENTRDYAQSYNDKVFRMATSISKSTGLFTTLSNIVVDTSHKLNCKFINRELHNLFDALCLDLVSQISTVLVYSTASSVLLFICTLFVYVSAMKFSHFSAINYYQQYDDDDMS